MKKEKNTYLDHSVYESFILAYRMRMKLQLKETRRIKRKLTIENLFL